MLKKITTKNLLLIIIIFVILFISPHKINAEQTVKDVSVNITLSSSVNASNYTKFIKLTNNDDVDGVNDNLSLLVSINLACESQTNNWNVTKTINSYSETGFGILSLTGENCTLCAKIAPLNFEDTNETNNFVCKNISVINLDSNKIDLNETSLENYTNNNTNSSINICANATTNITDNITVDANSSINNSLNISTNSSEELSDENNNSNSENQTCNYTCALKIETNKEIFSEGEKIEFKIIDCENTSKYSVPVEYWIEDKEKIVKQKINTTSKAVKAYTPSINEEKYFLIKAKTTECGEGGEEYQKLVVFTMIDGEESTYIKLDSSDETNVDWKKDEIIYADISGFKEDSSKTLISVWLEYEGIKKSKITKIYVDEKNSHFNFKIPLVINVEETSNYELVAEGLGEKESKKIKLNVQNKKTQEETNQENIQDEEIKQKETVEEITSFYTRKKTFSNNITVYVSLKNSSQKTLIIRSSKEQKVIDYPFEKNSVNISIGAGDETLLAEVYYREKLLEYKQLELNLSSEQEEKEMLGGQAEFKSFNKPQLNSSQNFLLILQNKSLEKVNNTNNTEKSQNKITGQVASVELGNSGIIFIVATAAFFIVVFSRKRIIVLIKKKLWKK